MDYSRKELLVQRILAGSLRYVRGSRVYWLRQPSREDRYAAQEIYHETLRQGERAGLFTDEELIEYLIKNDLWSLEKEDNLKKLEKDIEEFKIGLLKFVLKKNEQNVTRKALEVAKKTWHELVQQKHQLDHHSASGVASLKKLRYMIGCGLYLNGNRVWQDEGFWRHRSSLLDNAVSFYLSNKLGEAEFRELARTDPWRGFWGARKASNTIFGIPAADLSDEQKQIVQYSILYDNVYEHPDCPSETVIADDDMLDGWMILQRRQRQHRHDQAVAEQFLTNDKIKNSGEIFLMADNAEAAAKIDSLNDPTSRAIKKMRMKALQQKGEIEEAEMPDSMRHIQMEMNRMAGQAGKK